MLGLTLKRFSGPMMRRDRSSPALGGLAAATSSIPKKPLFTAADIGRGAKPFRPGVWMKPRPAASSTSAAGQGLA